MLGELLINILASAVFLACGFFVGKYRERRARAGKNLEQYDFYPFALDDDRTLYFDLERFSTGVDHLRKHRDDIAARQLILVGEQNDVEHQLDENGLDAYHKLFDRYDGARIVDDSLRFLDNYKRIVRLIGDSFPDSGMEILLHNLVNPAKALHVIRNNVTGRELEAPATNLVLDLKRRDLRKEDKLNYELNIGARRFKCTTIPIYREKFGLVGAICINVDANYLTEWVAADADRMRTFIERLCRTDMQLDENILNKREYEAALEGKRHFRDVA